MRRVLVVALLLVLLVVQCHAETTGIVFAFEKREYTILAGKSEIIKPVIQGTTKKGRITYESEDNEIAKVNNGHVTGIAAGDTEIRSYVAIDGREYNCSYILHVQQPVQKIELKYKELNAPRASIIRDPLAAVLPENATNKEVEYYISSGEGKGKHFNSDRITTGSYGVVDRSTHKLTLTCQALDGSGTKASMKITISSKLYKTIGNQITIDSPHGIGFFCEDGYFNCTGNKRNIVKSDVVRLDDYRSTGYEEEFKEYWSTQPFEPIDMDDWCHVQIYPVGVGNSQIWLYGYGRESERVNVTVLRSAVFEEFPYDNFSSKAQVGLRYSVQGQMADEGPITNDYYTRYFWIDGDESKPILLMGNYRMAHKIDDEIKIEGVYEGTKHYITETGLTKDIPVVWIESIDSINYFNYGDATPAIHYLETEEKSNELLIRQQETDEGNETEYIGNVKSKIFHYPDCKSVTVMKDKNKVEFLSREEAVGNGYKPCGSCNP